MSKHTPGPWAVKELKDRYRLRCSIESTEGSPVGEAYEEKNAPLIAAAPDLLEALEIALDCAGDAWWAEKAEAAIAKAKGE